MEVYWYADRNGINNFYVKVTKRSSIDLLMTFGLFIEKEPSKLGQWCLLGIFSRAIHNVTLYDSIFACKNILALVLIGFIDTKLNLLQISNTKQLFNKLVLFFTYNYGWCLYSWGLQNLN